LNALRALEGAWRRVKVYDEPEPDEWQEVLLPRLKEMATAEIARRMGVDRSTVKRWKSGVQRPRREMMARLREFIRQG
jgi:DNA-directed RNA polymerase specialized sigma24 family protein